MPIGHFSAAWGRRNMESMAGRDRARLPPAQRRQSGTTMAFPLASRSRSTRATVLDPAQQVLIDLQRTAGNVAVTQLVQEGRGAALALQRDTPTATAPAQTTTPTPAVDPDPDDIAWIDGLSVNQLQMQIDTEKWSKAAESTAEAGVSKQGEAAATAYAAKQKKKIAKLLAAKKPAEAASATKEMEDTLTAMGVDTAAKVQAVKTKYLSHQQENRRKFMLSMRHWFGTDDKIKEHFQNITAVPQATGETAYLYKPAADQLFAVQEIIKARGFTPPSTSVSQWLRDRHLGHWSKGYMGHPMGLAVDYDAYANPKISDTQLSELIQLATVGAKGDKSQVPSRLALANDSRATVKEMGLKTKAADEALAAKKGKVEDADVDFTKTEKYKSFFDTFNDQFDKMAAGSKKFQTDLGTDNVALLQKTKLRYIEVLAALPPLQAELQGIGASLKTAADVDKPDLLKKQQELQARQDAMADELEAMPATLATAFKPWLDRAAERAALIKAQADKEGVVAAKVPYRKVLASASSIVGGMAKAEAGLKKESGKKKPNPAPWEARITASRAGLVQLLGPALLGDPKAWSSIDWGNALKVLRRWNEAGFNDEAVALERLQTSLRDVTYVFGQVTDTRGGKRKGSIDDALASLATERKSATLMAMAEGQSAKLDEAAVYGSTHVESIDAKTKVTYGASKRVKDPTPMQLIEMGYFNPTDTFSKLFFELMMEHGFQPGAAWSPGSTDPMHFDYVPAFDQIAEGNFGPD